MNTINWEDFMNGIAKLNTNNNFEEPTNIKCPKCGELIFKITNQVYTTYPPKYKYKCKNCKWEGYA